MTKTLSLLAIAAIAGSLPAAGQTTNCTTPQVELTAQGGGVFVVYRGADSISAHTAQYRADARLILEYWKDRVAGIRQPDLRIEQRLTIRPSGCVPIASAPPAADTTLELAETIVVKMADTTLARPDSTLGPYVKGPLAWVPCPVYRFRDGATGIRTADRPMCAGALPPGLPGLSVDQQAKVNADCLVFTRTPRYGGLTIPEGSCDRIATAS